jgi:trk system potassium uptake protein TrkA
MNTSSSAWAFRHYLCTSLTAMGHEVIGVDKDMQKVNQVKDRITHAVCLDSSDIHAVTTLPLKDADIVIVCIGEDIAPRC